MDELSGKETEEKSFAELSVTLPGLTEGSVPHLFQVARSQEVETLFLACAPIISGLSNDLPRDTLVMKSPQGLFF